MTHPILKYFEEIQYLSPKEQAAILNSLEESFIKKGTLLLHPNLSQASTYFVIKGCIRQYYLKDGVECTSNFYTENQWLIAPSHVKEYYWEATEDTYLVVGNNSKAQALYASFPQFQQVAQQILEKVIEQQQEWMAGFITNSAEERYQVIIEKRPDLLQRVPQHQLASYIGVKPETLSRIRRRLTQNKKSKN